ncbi:MAG: methyltransferase domain-containing protein [Actinobacteria bacterium]|nr:methyltransferase domain-containing protein [Actinomycetota bacterium]
MGRKLLPKSALDAVKRSPRLYAGARALRFKLGRFVPPRQFDGIPGRIHFNDLGLPDDSPPSLELYRSGAELVVDHIEQSLAPARQRLTDIDAWLDFGCGYGRVVRALATRVEPQRIWAADVNREAVEFCAREFGVHPIVSTPDVATLTLPSVDYIYAISVLTHLPPERGRELLRVFAEALRPGGYLLFTTHGRWALDRPEWYAAAYAQMQRRLREEVDRDGVAYIPYHHYGTQDYGMTWHSSSRVAELVGSLRRPLLEQVLFAEDGLGESTGHQDVHVYRRSPES